MIRALFFLLGILLTGCSTMSPQVRLNPTAPASMPLFKDHSTVVLVVEDARTDPSLGSLLAGRNEKGTPTQSTEPVAQVVQRHVTEALTRAGFQVIPSNPTSLNASQVTVQVKKLEFKLEHLGVSSQINGVGSLAVTIQAGKSTRTKTYNAENGKKWALNPPLDGHEIYMNQLLTDLLNAFLSDEEFLSSLTKPS